MPSNRPASSARSISERRTRNDSTRARSTRSKTSSPFCSRTVSPRMAPSSRMSSRIGSVASRPTLVRRTAPIGASDVSEAFSHHPSIGDQDAARSADGVASRSPPARTEKKIARTAGLTNGIAVIAMMMPTPLYFCGPTPSDPALNANAAPCTRARRAGPDDIDRGVGRTQLRGQKVRHVDVHVCRPGGAGSTVRPQPRPVVSWPSIAIFGLNKISSERQREELGVDGDALAGCRYGSARAAACWLAGGCAYCDGCRPCRCGGTAAIGIAAAEVAVDDTAAAAYGGGCRCCG